MKKYIDNQHLIERIDLLIRLKATGIAKEYAQKLCISRRTLFRWLDYLRETGKPVKYCRYRKAYYYD
jgi:predicted DNA-binding transcriptional regulator YafY